MELVADGGRPAFNPGMASIESGPLIFKLPFHHAICVCAARGLALGGSLLLSACLPSVGPDYVRPSAPAPAQFKEAKGWKFISPIDTQDRGAWWTIYRDPGLDALASQVEISNQTVIASVAAYQLARDLIREAQAGYFPTVTTSYSATDQHLGGARSGRGAPTTTMTYSPTASATWDIDVWGRIRRTVEANAAAAQVSAADLADAKLSEQSLLVEAYFNLRATDSLKKLLDDTIVEYKKTLQITENQYHAGTVSSADVVTAKTQLLAAEAASINTGVLRSQYEHAIAVLTGRPPSELSMKIAYLPHNIPSVPVTVPSRLLERRPDIAASERMLQEENALIGVAVANFYPDINLSAMFGFAGGAALPISAAAEAWTLVGSASQTIFDGGLLSADLAAARATYQQNVALYRQTVLTAFEQVEDELSAIRVEEAELKKQDAAVKAAQEAVRVYLNQYTAGLVAFTTVVTAEATELSDREAALATRQNLFIASVALIEALGGGWDASLLPNLESLSTVPTITPPL
jgi:NodT family efflux transporter outer membrane factor (OMF) lipoprotein